MSDRSGPLSGLLVADFSRVLAGPYATMLLGRPRRRGGQGREPGRRRHPHAGCRRPGGRRLDVLPGDQPQQALGRPGPQGRGRPRRSRTSWPAAPTSSSRTSSPAGWPGSASTTTPCRPTNPARRLRLDQRLRLAAGGARPARLRPHRAGDVRADEPDRRPRRAALPGRHLGVRRDGRPARDHRHPRRAPAPRHATGRVSTSRSTCCPRRCRGLVNQTSAYVAGGVVPFRMGNAHPSLFPYEPLPDADGDLIITAGNDGQFRRLCEVLGVPELADDPRFAAQRGPHREPRRAAPAARRAAGDPHRRTEWFDATDRRRACRAARSTRSTRAWPSPRRSGSTRWSPSATGTQPIPSVRHPITLLRHPARYELPPPGARRARRRDPRLARSRHRRARSRDAMPRPSPRRSAPRRRRRSRLLGQDLAADLMGKVGFGELAFWLVAAAPPDPAAGPGVRGRARRAGRPRLHADRHRGPAHLPVARPTRSRAPWPPACSAAARASSASPRTAARFLARRARRPRRRPPQTDDAGWDAVALAAVRRAQEAGRFVPGLGHPVHKDGDPRTPVLIAHRRGGGRCAARTCACSRRSAGCTSRCSADACRSTAPGSAAPPWPTSGCRSSCCAGSPCSPGPPGCSASSPRSGAARSAWTSTSPSTATPSTSTPHVLTQPGEETRTWRRSSPSSPRRTTRSTTARAPRPERSARRSRTSGCAKIERFRETLTRARPDVLVMVGSDHFHQLWLDNMPQFLVGKAPCLRRQLVQRGARVRPAADRLDGHEDLSSHILRGGLDSGFDLAFSNELRIDHSITCPIITLRPQADLPIVPIYTNIFAPPLPQPKRFVELGRTIRELVESWPSDQRVAIIGTGHLSLELGGPRQFGPHGPDPEFDRQAVEWIANGDLDGCLREVTPGQPAPARQRHPRLHGLHADDGRGRREREGRPRRQPRPVPHDGGLLHLVPERSAGMSKYLLDKFLFTVDRDPDLVERYREDPAGTVAWWEETQANRILNVHRRRGEHLAGVHRRGARGARRARPRRAVRAWARTRSSR